MSAADDFWGAQSTWWSSRKDAQKKASKLRTGDPVGKRFLGAMADGAQWLTGGGQTGLVRVDPRLQRDVLEILRKVAPKLIEAYEEHIGGLAQETFDSWPVKTGLSKALLSLEFVLAGDTARGRLVSRAPYTPYIKGQPYRTFEAKGHNLAKTIADQALGEIVRG